MHFVKADQIYVILQDLMSLKLHMRDQYFHICHKVRQLFANIHNHNSHLGNLRHNAQKDLYT